MLVVSISYENYQKGTMSNQLSYVGSRESVEGDSKSVDM